MAERFASCIGEKVGALRISDYGGGFLHHGKQHHTMGKKSSCRRTTCPQTVLISDDKLWPPECTQTAKSDGDLRWEHTGSRGRWIRPGVGVRDPSSRPTDPDRVRETSAGRAASHRESTGLCRLHQPRIPKNSQLRRKSALPE